MNSEDFSLRNWPQIFCECYVLCQFFCSWSHGTIGLDPHQQFTEKVPLAQLKSLTKPSNWRPSVRCLKWLQLQISIIHASLPHSPCTKIFSICTCPARGHGPHYKMQQKICREDFFRCLELVFIFFLLACWEALCCLCHSEESSARSTISLCNHLAHENCKGGE